MNTCHEECVWQVRGGAARLAKDTSVFDDLDAVKSWTIVECRDNLRKWAPDLIQKLQIDGAELLDFTENLIRLLLFDGISDEDVRSLYCLLHKKDKSNEPARDNPEEPDAYVQSRAFSTQYKDPNGEVGRFLWYVRECSKQYHQMRHYFLSPYITVEIATSSRGVAIHSHLVRLYENQKYRISITDEPSDKCSLRRIRRNECK